MYIAVICSLIIKARSYLSHLQWLSCCLACGCVVQRLGDTPKMNAGTVGVIFGKFLYLFIASLLMGLVLGLLSALLLKRYNVSHTPQVASRSHSSYSEPAGMAPCI